MFQTDFFFFFLHSAGEILLHINKDRYLHFWRCNGFYQLNEYLSQKFLVIYRIYVCSRALPQLPST